MAQYQGRALEREPRRSGRPSIPGWGRTAMRMLVLALGLGALAMVPWRGLRHRYAVLASIKVVGVRYLDAARIRRDGGLREGLDLIALDLARVRQRVMMDPRVERAEVRRRGFRGLEVRVVERVPALAVPHGEPWEIDTAGVLLEPLQRGVVADVPMLTGIDFSPYRPGTQVRTEKVQRGLAWAAVLGDNALRLAGQVSEVDVTDERTTRLVLMDGVRVLGPAWPVSTRQLSGLRATLADLGGKGMKPAEVDVRTPNQIIVRDAQPIAAVAGAGPGTS
jgi:cell division protein FtsQ